MSAVAGQIDAALILREARFAAARLVRSGRLPSHERDDAAAELVVGCLHRAKRFDPARASFRTFVALAIRSTATSLLRRRAATKRLAVRPPCARTDQLPHLEFLVRDVIDRLPTEFRSACADLSEHSFTETARRLAISRTRMRTLIRQIRARFVVAGWEGAA